MTGPGAEPEAGIDLPPAFPAVVREMDLVRVALAVARDPSALQAKLDCAALAMEAGHAEAARALAQLALIRSGFSLEREARRFGLAMPAPPMEPAVAGCSTLAIAEAELAMLVADARLAVPPLEEGWALIEGALPLLDRWAESARHDRGGRLAATTPLPALAKLVASCGALHRLLVAPWSKEVGREMELLLGRLAGELADVPPFHAAGELAEPERLLAAVLAIDLRQFLLANRPLAFAPVGSAGTLHAAARLTSDGLGPYLSRVPELVRTGRDLPALLQRARRGASDEAALARWLPLLAAHIHEGQRDTLVDDLADRGLMLPLQVFAAIAIARSFGWHDRGVAWRIRDVGLDVRHYALAATMQEVIARWSVDNANEWRILADIHVTAGDGDAAKCVLRRGAEAAGASEQLRQRFAAIAAGAFTEMKLASGFSSNVDRAERRRRALAARS